MHHALGRNYQQMAYLSGLPGVARGRTRAFHHWLATLDARPFLFPGLVAGGPIAAPEPGDVAMPHGRPIPIWGYSDGTSRRHWRAFIPTTIAGPPTSSMSIGRASLSIVCTWRGGGPAVPQRHVPPCRCPCQPLRRTAIHEVPPRHVGSAEVGLVRTWNTRPINIPRQMFQEILRLIAELGPQPPPAPA